MKNIFVPFLVILTLIVANVPMPVAAATKSVSLKSSCPTPSKHKSPNSTTEVNVRFVNKSSVKLTLVWIGFDGSLTVYGSIGKKLGLDIRSFVGHNWLAVDKEGNCYGGVMSVDAATPKLEIR